MTSPTVHADFLYGARRREARLVHGVQDAPMHRLEAVADVGERSGDDDAHRVLEERVPQLASGFRSAAVVVPLVSIVPFSSAT